MGKLQTLKGTPPKGSVVEFLLSNEGNSNCFVFQGTVFPPKGKKGIPFEHGNRTEVLYASTQDRAGGEVFFFEPQLTLHMVRLYFIFFSLIIFHPRLPKAFVNA